MAAGPSEGEDGISGINVTPLVDIMLVLVIILMVTAEFTKYRTVPIALPKVNAAAMKREPHKVALTIKDKNKIYWNDELIKKVDALPARLKAVKQVHPDVAVILRAEGKTPYEKLLNLLDRVKVAGISKVGLAVDADKKGKKK
jgi:biopolymer transport protein ExbD